MAGLSFSRSVASRAPVLGALTLTAVLMGGSGAAAATDPVTAATTGGAWAAAPSTVSATLYDSVSGRTVTLHGSNRVYAASTEKVPILLEALLASRGGNLNARSAIAAYAKDMITHSDNDAATAIWRAEGRETALARLRTQLHLTGTSTTRPLYLPWDGVRTSSADMVTTLRAIVSSRAPVTRADSTLVLGLMKSVEADQAWGVSAGIRPADGVLLKNGWVPVPGHGWTVNTMGIVFSHGKYYCLAVTSTDQPSLAAGIKTVERLARQVSAHLG